MADLSIDWHDLEWEVDISSDAVGHQLEHAIRGYEGDRALFVEFG